MKCRRFSKKNEESFIALMEEASWAEVFNYQDAELACPAFMKMFSSSFDKCFPLGQITRKKHSKMFKPWITAGIQRSSREKKNI